MVQPKKPPVSLRLPEPVRVAVEQYATERGMPRNAAYVELLQRGLKVAVGTAAPRAKAEVAALREQRRAIGKVAAMQDPFVRDLTGVQFGPTPTKPGSRLKGTKK